jgi:ABC-2 type transport system ATP-binding protein
MSISVAGLTKVYGTQKAVDNISFELKKGEIVGFLGPNGAGKSTTMKMITGYLPATSGVVKVSGFDVATQPLDVKRSVGYLPEANPLYYDMYVREFLEFSAGVHKLSNVKQRIEQMIDITGLGKEAHKKIGMLSKGYPQVLILDEPTSGLDPNQLAEIRDLILRIGKEKTVLLSTHIMQEVQAMCSRVIIINNGRIVADDSIDKIQQVNSTQGILLVSFETAVDTTLFQRLKNLKQYEAIGQNKYKMTTDKPEELRKEVMQLALNHDINISSLQAETQSLEDVFRSLTVKN